VGESVKLAANINTTKLVQTNASSIDYNRKFQNTYNHWKRFMKWFTVNSLTIVSTSDLSLEMQKVLKYTYLLKQQKCVAMCASNGRGG
jgi:hypothetical protein